jgi:hypothetical protein
MLMEDGKKCVVSFVVAGIMLTVGQLSEVTNTAWIMGARFQADIQICFCLCIVRT